MSSMNPVVGVSLCIGALGAGLAYLAWNNQDDDVDQHNNEKVNTEEENNDVTEEENNDVTGEENNDVTGEKNVEPKETVEETTGETTEESNEKQDVELKTIKVSKASNDSTLEEASEKQSNMKQFLKESYENSKQN
jgi:hypothetical protein